MLPSIKRLCSTDSLNNSRPTFKVDTIQTLICILGGRHTTGPVTPKASRINLLRRAQLRIKVSRHLSRSLAGPTVSKVGNGQQEDPRDIFGFVVTALTDRTTLRFTIPVPLVVEGPSAEVVESRSFSRSRERRRRSPSPASDLYSPQSAARSCLATSRYIVASYTSFVKRFLSWYYGNLFSRCISRFLYS